MKSLNKEGSQLSNIVAKKLLEEIKSGRYKNSSRLPSELEIGIYMGASRSAVRDALSVLEMQGFVGRKRGLGTVINRHVLEVTTRLDLEEEFLNMIKQAGFSPKVESVQIETIKSTDEITQKLFLRKDEEVYRISRIVSADGINTIFCRDYFTKKLIKTHDYNEEELKPPIFYFLDNRCKERVNMDLSEIHALPASKVVAKALDIPYKTPVLLFQEVGYNFNGLPILYSEEYYREGILNHTVLRKNVGFDF